MFADDVSSVADTVLILQRQINSIYDVCKDTCMNLILDKSKIIVFEMVDLYVLMRDGHFVET